MKKKKQTLEDALSRNADEMAKIEKKKSKQCKIAAVYTTITGFL